ncbi:MAG: hypothetical protein AB1403_04730 [Candidatus Riflebacteria bacterium]
MQFGLLILSIVSLLLIMLFFRCRRIAGLIFIAVPGFWLFSFTSLNLYWLPVFISGTIVVLLLSIISMAGKISRPDLQNFVAAVFLRAPSDTRDFKKVKQTFNLWRSVSWANCVLTAHIGALAIFIVGFFANSNVMFKAEPPAEDMAGIFMPTLVLLLFNQIWLKLAEHRFSEDSDQQDLAENPDFPGHLWLLPPLGIFVCWFQEIGMYFSSF